MPARPFRPPPGPAHRRVGSRCGAGARCNPPPATGAPTSADPSTGDRPRPAGCPTRTVRPAPATASPPGPAPPSAAAASGPTGQVGPVPLTVGPIRSAGRSVPGPTAPVLSVRSHCRAADRPTARCCRPAPTGTPRPGRSHGSSAAGLPGVHPGGVPRVDRRPRTPAPAPPAPTRHGSARRAGPGVVGCCAGVGGSADSPPEARSLGRQVGLRPRRTRSPAAAGRAPGGGGGRGTAPETGSSSPVGPPAADVPLLLRAVEGPLPGVVRLRGRADRPAARQPLAVPPPVPPRRPASRTPGRALARPRRRARRAGHRRRRARPPTPPPSAAGRRRPVPPGHARPPAAGSACGSASASYGSDRSGPAAGIVPRGGSAGARAGCPPRVPSPGNSRPERDPSQPKAQSAVQV